MKVQVKVPANSVPAAAVIRRGRALFKMTGRKEHVGGLDLLFPRCNGPPCEDAVLLCLDTSSLYGGLIKSYWKVGDSK